MSIKIKQTYMNDAGQILEIQHGSFDIIADDGRDLFTVSVSDDGALSISAESIVKHGEDLLETGLSVSPEFRNKITIYRDKYLAQSNNGKTTGE